VNRADLLAFLRKHKLAVQATVSSKAAPQAAVVGIAVTDGLEIVFDTLDTTRKVENLRQNPQIAFVIGWDEERTVQLEGLADLPSGEELERLKEVYFAAWPDGRERQRWPGLVYVRARPTWIRYSDFTRTPTEIVVFEGECLS
jgi:general stress protein 26